MLRNSTVVNSENRKKTKIRKVRKVEMNPTAVLPEKDKKIKN